MEGLYKNIGDKVCKVAKFCGFLGMLCLVVGIICCLIGIDDEDVLIVGLVGVVTGIATVISSWPLYAFGQITNDIRALKNAAEKNGSAPQPAELPDL